MNSVNDNAPGVPAEGAGETHAARNVPPDPATAKPAALPEWIVADLAKSGIPVDAALALGWRHVAAAELPALLGRSNLPGDSDGLLIPFLDPFTGAPLLTPDGRPFVRVRLRVPCVMRPGEKPAKYLSPVNGGIRVFTPPAAAVFYRDHPAAPLLVTEGEKKALAATLAGHACLALTGIDCWRQSRGERADGLEVHPDLLAFLAGRRELVMVYDSDAADPAKAADFDRCAGQLARALLLHGVALRRRDLPAAPDGVKVGLDDYLLAHGAAAFAALLPAARLVAPLAPPAVAVGRANASVPVVTSPLPEAPEAWQAPAPLGGLAGSPPPWPWEAFPLDLAALGQDVATCLRVPPELPGLAILCLASMAIRNRLEVCIRESHRQHANLYGLVAMPPSTGKTPALRPLLAPFHDWETAQLPDWQDRLARWRAEAKTAASAVAVLEKELARAQRDNGDVDAIRNRLAAEEAKCLTLGPEPEAPRVYCEDVTSEALARRLQANGGAVGIVSSEARKVLAVAKGRYVQEGDDLDVWLKGHAGDPIRIDRQGKPPVDIRRPCVAAFLALQPEPLRALGESEAVRGSGFLARFLFAVPECRRGDYPEKDLDPDGLAAWGRLVRALLALPGDTDADGLPVPAVVALAADAFALWQDCHNATRRQMTAGEGSLPLPLVEWLGKLPEHVARVALVFHSCEHAGAAALPPISAATMARAWLLGDCLQHHARRAFSVIGEDLDAGHARRVWDWCARNVGKLSAARDDDRLGPLLAVKETDLSRAEIAGLDTVEKVRPVLARLEERGYLQAVRLERPGKKAVTLYYLNPLALRSATP